MKIEFDEFITDVTFQQIKFVVNPFTSVLETRVPYPFIKVTVPKTVGSYLVNKTK